ncbi:hypothetical protein CFC21_082698 [Triticum aestivum]|uniref:Uncharacterized protein n=3 Tax=Triticum TaxID=4564 RepID=A0A9R0XVX7_TRITD|nr:probable coatomer subunit beta' [Triticum aestivum]KAF7078224.1 hypothetical protein CFC21_082698 [Triticum aestivum]VAI44038.1 unnamed protein product [Triticum turgidum subsp. durum]
MCVRISRNTYPNLRALRNASHVGLTDAPHVKISEGDFGHILDDVPHLADYYIPIWSIGSPDPNFTLDGHSKGVNRVDYFTGGDRPFFITGSDDQTAKRCVQTLEGYAHNVSAVCFHLELPIIITGSEDGTVRLWHSTTYRLENTLHYGLERVWALGYMKGSRRIVIGYDLGKIMIKIGREVPVASMDNSEKILWAKHNEIQTVSIKTVGAGNEVLLLCHVKCAGLSVVSLAATSDLMLFSPIYRFLGICCKAWIDDLETALTGVVVAPGQLWSPPLAPTGRIPLPLASPLSTISCPPLGGAAVAAGAYAKPGDIAIDGRRRTVFVAFVHFREEDNSR